MEWTARSTLLFIKDYRNSPELWNAKCAAYKDYRMKNFQLRRLSIKYGCSVAEVRKKIKNLRSAFLRERKRLERRKGSSKARWFAYEPLSFLKDVDMTSRKIRRKMNLTATEGYDLKQEEVSASDIEDVQATPPCSVPSTSTSNNDNELLYNETEEEVFVVPKKKLKTNSCMSVSSDHEETGVFVQHATQRDEYATYGDHVGNELRNLTLRAQTIAKHLINNVLFNAAMGKYDHGNPSSTSTNCTCHSRNQYALDSDISVKTEELFVEEV